MTDATIGRLFQGEDVTLSRLAGVEATIDGFRFQDCVILGPAVLVMQDVQLVDCDFGGEPSELLWEISDERQRVMGAILVSDSVFEKCRFINVGFAGPTAFVEAFTEELQEYPAE
jgi:hypothetical protein